MNRTNSLVIRCKKDGEMAGMENHTYFDLLSHFGIGGAHPGGFLFTKELLSTEQIHKDSNILDAGCGTGQTAAYLYNQFKANISGIDINSMMLMKARERFETQQVPVHLYQASIEELPFADNTFDLVLSESVLAFVQKKKALAEIYRVLKKGGKLLANEMTINHPVSMEEEMEIVNFYQIDWLLLEEDWRNLLTDAGYRKIEILNGKKDLLSEKQMPEFHFSPSIEPELFGVLNQHAEILIKFCDSLSFRILKAVKE